MWRKRWLEWMNQPAHSTGDICSAFILFIETVLGAKRITACTKRWRTPDVDSAHAHLSKARAALWKAELDPQGFKDTQRSWSCTPIPPPPLPTLPTRAPALDRPLHTPVATSSNPSFDRARPRNYARLKGTPASPAMSGGMR